MERHFVHFVYKNVPNHEPLRAVIRNEFTRVYNAFCDKVNVEGVCDRLSEDFFKDNPGYKVADDLWSSVEYVEHFRKGYAEVVDVMNRENISELLELYIGDELDLEARLKMCREATISFYLKKEGS
jgi:hypothetical protein